MYPDFYLIFSLEVNTMKMLDYVKASPQKVKDNINEKENLVTPLVRLFCDQDYVSVIIIASGSSMNAAQMVQKYMANRLNRPVSVITPELFELLQAADFSNTFIFFVSQSGASTNILHAMNYMKTLDRRTILLTGNIHSQAAGNADYVIDYGVGIETVGYVTIGLSTLIIYLALFANEAALLQNHTHNSDEEFYQLADVMSCTINEGINFVDKHFLELAEMGPTFICGNNMNLGVAREAALKFQETLKIPTMHYEVEEFMHGPDIQLSPKYTVFLIDNLQPSSRIARIYKELAVVTSRSYLVTFSDKQKEQNIVHITKPIIQDLCSLAAIPFFQVIVATMMAALNKEKSHPFADKFMKAITTKNYSQKNKG